MNRIVLRRVYGCLFGFGLSMFAVFIANAKGNLESKEIADSLVSVFPQTPIVKCYPNPASNYINFIFDKPLPLNGKLLVFSFTGRKMAEMVISSDKIQLQLDNYFRGLYMYQVVQKNGDVIDSGKFQVLQ